MSPRSSHRKVDCSNTIIDVVRGGGTYAEWCTKRTTESGSSANSHWFEEIVWVNYMNNLKGGTFDDLVSPGITQKQASTRDFEKDVKNQEVDSALGLPMIEDSEELISGELIQDGQLNLNSRIDDDDQENTVESPLWFSENDDEGTPTKEARVDQVATRTPKIRNTFND